MPHGSTVSCHTPITILPLFGIPRGLNGCLRYSGRKENLTSSQLGISSFFERSDYLVSRDHCVRFLPEPAKDARRPEECTILLSALPYTACPTCPALHCTEGRGPRVAVLGGVEGRGYPNHTHHERQRRKASGDERW